jgi:hypothetical protein
LKVVDLFCGLGGFSQAFKNRGHEVITVDIEKKFNPTICADIMTLGADDFHIKNKAVTIVLASPPCNCFSVASIGKRWTDIGRPKGVETLQAISLIYYTIWLIKSIAPRYWILENPMGMLRKVIGKPKAKISLCQYGDKRMKPTDLWGDLPNFPFRKCKNGNNCHESAPRGTRRGTQGLSSVEERAKMPLGLSEIICSSVEGAVNKENLLSYYMEI